MSNIIGEGFESFVDEQVNKRQEILGSINRTTEQILWANSKTSFVKLVSSADITDLDSLGGGFAKSDELAIKYVLFNGVTNEIPRTNPGIENFQRAGIDSSRVYDNVGAYGLGGTDWGIQPMPGIISANIKSETMGSLRTGTVQIKANNKAQFDIISTLYLRVGYTMLLEWGNTSYFNNIGNYVSDNITSLADSFLIKKYNFGYIKDELGTDVVTYNNLLKAVAIQREYTDGNYDALIGRVVNYSWTFNRDGSYDITIILRSAGDVIEALKTNLLLPGKPTSSQIVGPTRLDMLTFRDIISAGLPNTSEDTIISFAQSSTIGTVFADIQKLIPKTNTIGTNTYSLDGSKSVDYFSQSYTTGQTQYFVRFGTFLQLIKNSIIPTINNTSEKILNVGDTDSDKILIYTPPKQIPSDPRICAFKKTLPAIEVEYNIPGATGFTSSTSEQTLYPDIDDFVISKGNNSYGKLMFCYFNMVFILKLLEDSKDTEGNVSLISLLNSMMSGFCKATGNFNSITPKIDYDTNTIVFIDKTSLPDRSTIITNKKTTQFNVYGLETNESGSIIGGSFVRDLQLKTEITPDLATMITIGATARGYVTGQDAIAISNLNKGTIDRIKPEISSPSNTKIQSENDNKDINDTYQETLRIFDSFTSSLIAHQWNEDSFANFTNTQKQLLEYDQKQSTLAVKTTNPYSSLPNNVFLPFILTLTMDGLSGMKIFNKFNIDSRFLPKNYPEAMEFVIMNISHTIQNNTWTTNITSAAIPLDPVGTKPGKQTSPIKTQRSSPNQSPLPYTNDPKLSDIRNTILRIAKGYIGQREIGTNEKFVSTDFENKMKSVGWSKGNSWCNFFADLVWKEAYQEVGSKDAKIKEFYLGLFNSFTPGRMPLAGSCETTFQNMKAKGYAEEYIPGRTIIKPGDMIFYRQSHISIAGAVSKNGFESIDGNYGNEGDGKVNYQALRTNKYIEKYHGGIRGIIRVPE